MQATALSVALTGLEAHRVRVEVDSGRGVSSFRLVGLPEASVRESYARVRAALSLFDVHLSELVVTVNLAPADLRKTGSGFDLAIAVAILAARAEVPIESLGDVILLGELSLGGELRPIRGVLPALLGAAAQGHSSAIVPAENRAEAGVVARIRSHGARDLGEVIEHLRGERLLPSVAEPPPRELRPGPSVDLAEVRGQEGARRALEIAAAGNHNLLMMGTPGAGKTMLARRLPTILPPMSDEEAIAVTSVHSVAGLLPRGSGLVRHRPFRAPHHTVSAAALLGGGCPVRPGEISLAHHGCLFLDELLEFPRPVLEGLRQPLESGAITVCRARSQATFPAGPLLVAAVNPCPCGFLGHPLRPCTCTAERIKAYQSRLSGPLLDRIDLQITVPPVTVDHLQSSAPAEASARVASRVARCRQLQSDRQRQGEVEAEHNAALSLADLDRIAPLDRAGRCLLRTAVARLGLTARGYAKVRRIARTVADLEGSERVGAEHLSEALQNRPLDRHCGSALAATAA